MLGCVQNDRVAIDDRTWGRWHWVSVADMRRGLRSFDAFEAAVERRNSPFLYFIRVTTEDQFVELKDGNTKSVKLPRFLIQC